MLKSLITTEAEIEINGEAKLKILKSDTNSKNSLNSSARYYKNYVYKSSENGKINLIISSR